MPQPLHDDLLAAINRTDWLAARDILERILRQCGLDSGSGASTDAVVAALRAVLEQPKPANQLPAGLDGHAELQTLLRDLAALRAFTLGLSRGDLAQTLPLTGYLGGVLKMLQANLKHLTWQTTMVAKGDFTQRVDFMGEFADAFNDMVRQLASARKELVNSEERYRTLAATDPLTGLYNRRHFFETALKEFYKAERASRTISLVMLDLDLFKITNDVHGHAAGDAVLKEVSSRLVAGLRMSDTACRFGGEEFVIALPETSIEQASQIAERIRSAIEQTPIIHGRHVMDITASLGISQFQGTGSDRIISEKDIERTISRADKALYKAKNAGRNTVAICP
ncbi:MAG: GGDEF domain-containing protein [Acidobacteriota bacterium]